MKERPILMNGAMVRAVLDGSKSQTRRLFKVQPPHGVNIGWVPGKTESLYGRTGDRLWVRETFMDLAGTGVEHCPTPGSQVQRYAYAADAPPGSYRDEARKDYGLKWRPSIHMPRAASRITLEITDVRVERLQNISEDDCWKEGIEQVMHDFSDESQCAMAKRLGCCIDDAKPLFASLWESINGQGSWDANPWVWAVSFKRVEPA